MTVIHFREGISRVKCSKQKRGEEMGKGLEIEGKTGDGNERRRLRKAKDWIIKMKTQWGSVSIWKAKKVHQSHKKQVDKRSVWDIWEKGLINLKKNIYIYILNRQGDRLGDRWMWIETRVDLYSKGSDQIWKCFTDIWNQILGVQLSSKKRINFNSPLSVLSDLSLPLSLSSPLSLSISFLSLIYCLLLPHDKGF